jgi:adenosine deaminase/adenosine deaminase CECR1
MFAALLSGCVAACAPPQDLPSQSPGAQANYQAARRYYASLVEGPAPDIAGLTLVMTMLPKGGDLHHHYSGSLYAETYLDWVKLKGYCIWRTDDARRKAVRFAIEASPKELSPAERANCLDADAVRDNNAFYRNLLSVWSTKDFYNHSQQQVAPDQHFFDTFGYFGAVSGADYSKGLRELKARALAENVQYIETMLRGSPSPNADPRRAAAVDRLTAASGDGEVKTALESYFDYLARDPATSEAVARYLADLEAAAAGRDHARLKLRFQSYTSRNDAPGAVFGRLYTAFAAANAGGRVVAVNIVGPENGVVSMRDYGLHMRMFAFLKVKFPAVRLAMHAGELTLGMVPPEGLQDHIREAVEIAGAARIGHGVDIAYERDADGLLREMRQRHVAVEINLTSNEFILGVKNEAHPLGLYRHAHVPYVISTDDSGVSRNNLSNEYVLYASRYKPGYDELKETVFNSIRYSFLTETEKAGEMRVLAQRFAVFEARMRDLADGLPAAR